MRVAATVFAAVLLGSVWALADQTAKKTLVLPIDDKASGCVFELFEGDPIEPGARALLADMGIGFQMPKEGTLVLIECGSAASFPGWLDPTGDLVSVLEGYGFYKLRPSGIPRLSDTADANLLRVLEKKNGVWPRVAGTFKTIAVPLPAGSKAASATYITFSSGSVSEYSARLLAYVGIATTGRQSRVKLIVGDYHGTGIVDAGGKLKVIDETRWLRDAR